MSRIELTEEQRRILEREPGKAVEVVDPATQEQYVMLAREQYEHMRTLAANNAVATSSPMAVSTSTASPAQPLRQRVRDLPLPREVTAEAERYCKGLGWWGTERRREIEEQMKLQHYYGGGWIAFLDSPAGPIIVAAAESLGDPLFDQQLAFLTPEERAAVRLSSPPVLSDGISEILTPFANED